MSNQEPITTEKFKKRIGDLCLRSGLAGFPKEDADQHILLKSALLVIGGTGPFTEKEINEKLQLWHLLTQMKDIDHGTLRRRLIDTGYLSRNKDGSEYQTHPGGSGRYQFEESIEEIDLGALLTTLREEVEARKRAFLQKSKGS